MILRRIQLSSRWKTISDHCRKTTTLGADDGIGVAFGLALLADDSIKHPAIEFVMHIR